MSIEYVKTSDPDRSAKMLKRCMDAWKGLALFSNFVVCAVVLIVAISALNIAVSWEHAFAALFILAYMGITLHLHAIREVLLDILLRLRD